MGRIRIECEYGAWPIWDEDIPGPIAPDELPISEALIRRIDAWDERFQATFDQQYPPSSGFSSDEDAHRFDAEGHVIRRMLRGELGPDWHVAYVSFTTGRCFGPGDERC